MTKRLKRRNKIFRQLQKNIWGQLIRKKVNLKARPGQHGNRPKRIKQHIFYIRQNIDKTDKNISVRSILKPVLLYNIKKYYSNVSKKYFDRLLNKKKNAYSNISAGSDNLLTLLERRLDTAIFRMNWTISFHFARQLINHGHILVNGKQVYNTSYLLNQGDVIEVHSDINKNLRQEIIKLFTQRRVLINCPSYFEVNYTLLKAIFVYYPKAQEIPFAYFKNVTESI